MTASTRLFNASAIEHLFHGTIEPLVGALRPGGYDGVFWTAESSAIAQCYIPATGGSTFASVSRYELDHHVRPAQACPFYSVAKMIGPPAKNVETDQIGAPRSWGIPAGYATYRQVIDHIENALGYARRDHCGDLSYELLTDGWKSETQEHVIVPSGYRKPGSLVIVDGFQEMQLLDLSRGESDLTDLQYHKLKAFREAEANGFDGVVIDDFCQSKAWGNVGHRSIGFFAHSLAKLQATVIPVVRFDWDETREGLAVTDSPEFVEWRRQASEQIAVARQKGG